MEKWRLEEKADHSISLVFVEERDSLSGESWMPVQFEAVHS